MISAYYYVAEVHSLLLEPPLLGLDTATDAKHADSVQKSGQQLGNLSTRV